MFYLSLFLFYYRGTPISPQPAPWPVSFWPTRPARGTSIHTTPSPTDTPTDTPATSRGPSAPIGGAGGHGRGGYAQETGVRAGWPTHRPPRKPLPGQDSAHGSVPLRGQHHTRKVPQKNQQVSVFEFGINFIYSSFKLS